jgi:predicted DNA-binding transcriptional regulator AlpA
LSDRILLSASQAATLLGMSRKSLWKYTTPRGDIPVVKVGRVNRYRRESLERWAAELEARQSANATG